MIREHGGDQLFQRTEEIRAASVERHRNEVPVDLRLGQLDLDDTLAFVRGFGLFSMLANLAEDREGMMAEQDMPFADALASLKEQGISSEQVSEMLDQALVMPVLLLRFFARCLGSEQARRHLIPSEEEQVQA